MTSIVLNFPHQDHNTVAIVDYEEQTAKVSSTRTTAEYTIYKSRDQTPFFKVQNRDGKAPNELSGHYSSLDKAVSSVAQWINLNPVTQSVINELRAKEREERKSAKSESKGH
jgi:hypothetical protein